MTRSQIKKAAKELVFGIGGERVLEDAAYEVTHNMWMFDTVPTEEDRENIAREAATQAIRLAKFFRI